MKLWLRIPASHNMFSATCIGKDLYSETLNEVMFSQDILIFPFQDRHLFQSTLAIELYLHHHKAMLKKIWIVT